MINNPWTLEAIEQSKKTGLRLPEFAVIDGEEKGKRTCGRCGDANAWFKTSIKTYKCRNCGAIRTNSGDWAVVEIGK